MKKIKSIVEYLRLDFGSRALVLLLAVFVPLSNSQTAFAVDSYDTSNVLTSSTFSSCSSNAYYIEGNTFKILANSNSQINKVQINLYRYLTDFGTQSFELYEDSNGSNGNLLGTFNVTTYPAGTSSGLATYVSNTPVLVNSGSYYWLQMNFPGACVVESNLTFSGTALTLNLDGPRIIRRFSTTVYNTDWTVNMAIFGGPSTSAPSPPTSVTATATGKRSATVSFAAPASDGDSTITSYSATSSPGGITKTLNQAGGGTFTFDNLEPSTSYTFAVTATNAIGRSAAATSNSIKTLALDVASISALSFADDGTGTGGKIVWAGKNIDAVLFTGPAALYPGPYNYGAFTSGWNGRIRNLTSDTSYTVSIFAVSADGVGESKSLTFKTNATLPSEPGSTNSTISQAAQIAAQLPNLFAWIDENVFVDGEGDRMKTVLNKFEAVKVPAASAYMKLPNSTVLSASATSSTPAVCTVEGQVTVRSIAAGTCTISYTVSGGSKAPATLVKDFVFQKFAK